MMKAVIGLVIVVTTVQMTWGSETVVRGRALAPLAITTTDGTTHYISACGVAPPVDPGLTVAQGATDLSVATVTITNGQVTDILTVDPDPAVACSFEHTCGPCPGLLVERLFTHSISISGDGTAAAYQACLRRVIFHSKAYGGQEGLGDRLISFEVIDSTDRATATKTVTYDADTPQHDLCFANGRIGVAFSEHAPPGFYPIAYDATCSGGPCNTVLIAPYHALAPGSLPGRAELFYQTTTHGAPVGKPYPAEDTFGILPDPADPASTPASPCPGLGYRRIEDGPLRILRVQIYGPASAEAYTACIRRAYYANTAPAGSATVDKRPISLRVYTVVFAHGWSYVESGIPLVVNASTTGVCSTAGTAACAGTAPTDEELPAPTNGPALPADPSPSPAAAASASPVSISSSVSPSSTPNAGSSAIGASAVAVASSAVAALLVALAMRDALRA
jgi:hypothetical protein